MTRKGIFNISIDAEVAWGQCDVFLTELHRMSLERERTIIQRLLALFATYDVRATWAVVGHLLLQGWSWRETVSVEAVLKSRNSN
jgi:hypothetical protein